MSCGRIHSTGPQITQQAQQSTEVQNQPVQQPQQSGPSEPAQPLGSEQRQQRMRDFGFHEQSVRSDLEVQLQTRHSQQGSVDPANYQQIQEHLSYSASDWRVSDADVRAVHSQLDHLSPADYRATLQRMNHDGLLSTYIDNMEATDRTAFLRQAAHQGYIQRMPASTHPHGSFNPPQPPTLLVNNRDLPTPVREAIHEQNMGLANGYYGHYREYLNRYSDGVLQAQSGAEIRRLGPPSDVIGQSEPGVYANDPDYNRFHRSWCDDVSENAPGANRAYVAVSDRMHDLNGQRRAGSFWFSAEVELGGERHVGPAEIEASYSRRFEVSDYGATRAEQGINAQASSPQTGIQVGGGVSQTSMTAPHGIQHQSEVEVSGSAGTEGEREIEGQGRIQASFEVEHDGTATGSLGLSGPAHGFASVNPEEGFMEQGVGISAERGDFRGQARVGVGFQGLSQNDALDAVAGDVGAFNTPPELERGVAWNSLPTERREYFQRMGWTEQEWGSRINAH